MKKNKQNAFTLIEALVSLFIISIAVAGIFQIISYTIGNANFIKNSFIANSLAQEGIEITRNLRDSDWLAQRQFGSFGNLNPVPNGIYCPDWNDDTIGNNCANTNLLTNGLNFFVTDSGTPSIFSRTVNIRHNPANNDEIIVLVEVSWKERTGLKKVNVEEHLFNWY